MNKVVKIKGLDCPNCAKALEGEINKLPSVVSAELDFLKGTISFESEDCDKAFKDIVSLTKQIEPDAKISKMESDKKSTKLNFIVDLSILVVGIVIGLVVLLVKMPTALFWPLFIISSLLIGYKTFYKAIILLTKGIVNENLLVTLSIIGASAVGEYMEGLMVICLYTIGKLLEGLAVNKSRNSIKELTNLKPDYAVVVKNNKEEKVAPEQVKINQIIIVRPGERVPLDGVVVEGSANINTQSLTGESLPTLVEANFEILSGSIVIDGVLKIKVTNEYGESTVSRILNLIENAQEKKSKTETVISKIARWYTFAVMGLAVAVFFLVWLILKDFNVAVYRGLIFLLISCPCAFAISVPLSYFSGIGTASKFGILIKGSNYLDALTKVNTIAFDKTGTLTSGEFEVENVEVLDKAKTQEDILFLASLGEQYSLHPLAKSIVKANTRELVEVKNVKEVAGSGVEFKYLKNNYFVGRKNKKNKSTTVEVYENDELIAKIYLKDSIKASSIYACKTLKDMGIKTLLLSGDNEETVKKVSSELNIEESYSGLLPEDKYNFIDGYKKEKGTFIGYVGDGINDAPSLTLADVGISMGLKGSASSIEASDIVLVDDNPEKISTAIKVSKYTQKIVWQNIILSAGIKIVFLTLGALGVTGMLGAVIADVGVTIMAILNSLRILKFTPKKHDKS